MNKVFPKIPDIIFIVTKPYSDGVLPLREEFKTWSEFEDWACDECHEEFDSEYRHPDNLNSRGCRDMREYVRMVMDQDEVITLVEEKGWKFMRVEV